MQIPCAIEIGLGTKQGDVFYFEEETFVDTTKPHNFIVLNPDAINDDILFLVSASTKIEKKVRFYRNEPKETLVFINPGEVDYLPLPTVINCNEVLPKSKKILIEKRENSKLVIRPKVPKIIMEKILKGVFMSRIVEEGKKRHLGLI